MWKLLASSLTAALLLTGCGSGTSDNYSSEEAPGGYVVFDTTTGNVPYPIDIFIDYNLTHPEKTHLNLPIAPDEDPGSAALKRQLNTLDGFSTTSPVTVGVTTEVDADTLPGNIFLIDTTSGPLQYGVDFVATSRRGKLALVPLKPLKGNTRYIVLLKKGILGADGKPIVPDYLTSLVLGDTPLIDATRKSTVSTLTDEQARQLENLRQVNINQLIPATGVPAAAVLDVWSFKTQTIGKVAEAFSRNNDQSADLKLKPFLNPKSSSPFTSKDILLAAGYDVNNTMIGSADVYMGKLENLPYYLGIPTPENNFTEPLSYYFEINSADGLPKETGRVDIPILITVPNTKECKDLMDSSGTGWPVVIFQHGITRNRLDVLAISEAFAKICYAVIGMDLPLHGITDKKSPFYKNQGLRDPGLLAEERTFDLDFLTQDANETILSQSSDGEPDTSGIHYINFESLLTARDNIRQSTSDYVELYNAIVNATEVQNGLDFDENNIAFVGHSLGTMAPFGYFRYQNEAGQAFKEVLLSMPGGGITDIMIHSQTFGKTVLEGLKKVGPSLGSKKFEAFVIAMQTILDDADPLNYAQTAAAKQKFLIHAVKDDDVIPNRVPSSPMSGGLPIIKLMGATDITDYFTPGETTKYISTQDEDIYTLFAKGNHRSLIVPNYNLETTIEMQTEMDTFIASEGKIIEANLSRILQ
ncbi:hypothetical protein [Hydrogenimonas sp. SS33]|uniref:hypothetical protein n=1 Tax=Hydrogenimonas leucolamina TaxID=2954236 RepID=UPI00336BB35F